MHEIALALVLAFAPWPYSPPADVALPPADDLGRFPSYQMCDNQLAFLAARRAWLDAQHGLYADPYYQTWFDAAYADVDARRLPWAVLYEAHGWAVIPNDMAEGDERRNYPAESRNKMVRRKLAELQDAIGPVDYNGGVMPGLIGPQFWCR
jgi:hypothetical protein